MISLWGAVSVIKHPEIFEGKNCLQTQITLLKIAPGMTLMSDGVKWCKKQSLFENLYYKRCMGCCYNSHLYDCLPAGPYICYWQWMSTLLEGRMFVLRLWQDRLSTLDGGRGSERRIIFPVSLPASGSSSQRILWLLQASLAPARFHRGMLTLGVERRHEVFNLTVRVWMWNSGRTQRDERGKLTHISSKRKGNTTWKDKEKLSNKKNYSCLGIVVGCGGEMKVAYPQRPAILEEQEKGKEIPTGCSGQREPRVAKGQCFLTALLEWLLIWPIYHNRNIFSLKNFWEGRSS